MPGHQDTRIPEFYLYYKYYNMKNRSNMLHSCALLAASVAFDIILVLLYLLFSIVREFIIKATEGCSLDFRNALKHINLLVMAISYSTDVDNRQYYWVL